VTRYLVTGEWSGIVDVEDPNELGEPAQIAAAGDWLMDGFDLKDFGRGLKVVAAPEEPHADDTIVVAGEFGGYVWKEDA
jgi:hypothetical protein